MSVRCGANGSAVEIGQQEAPVRLAALGLERRLLGLAELQRLAPVDRRQPPRQPYLAAELQLLRRLVAGIELAGRLQPFDGRRVGVEARRLVDDDVRAHAQPMQILLDLVGIFLPRAGDVGVVEAQHEAAAVLQREQPVEQRGARVADMDVAGRRRREADGDGHGCGGSEGQGQWQAFGVATRKPSCSARRVSGIGREACPA